MHLSITQKLVISFLGLTIIVLAGTLVLARWSFEQGFLDYVNALEQGRLQQTAADLAELYEYRNNDWQQVLASPLARRIDRSGTQPAPSGRGPGPPPPPPRGQPGFAPQPLRPEPGVPPPHRVAPDQPGSVPGTPPVPELMSGGGANPLPGPGLKAGPGTFTRERRRRMPPTSLCDAQGNHLAGPFLSTAAEGQIVVPIEIDDVVVGELRTQPRRDLNTTQETEFSQQQLNASIVIAAVALLIAVLISVVLARALLAPVRRLMSAVNSMANGSYEITLGARQQDELGALMQNVERLAHALRESQASRKRWLADISHELRTPVTILIGELEALQMGVRHLDQQQLDSFAEEVSRINKLVDDLYQLALSDIGALRYQFAAVDVYTCLETVVDTLNQQPAANSAQKATSTPISLSGDSTMIYADSSRLHQLFMNLLRNSLFYTDHPGKIEVEVRVMSQQVVIDIDDTPPGVGQAQCARLFEPLYRQDASRSRREAGAGLGLAICRNIVEAHHGQISASPSKLGGLHIHIQLPMNKT